VFNKTAFICAFFLALIIVISIPSYNGIRAEGLLEEVDYSFDARIGYHYADVNGYRGKVGEYEVLDPGMEGAFNLRATIPGKYFDLGGEILDEDDQRYMMDLDVNRIFQMETSYNRYTHYLDHVSLSNQDFYTDFDAGENNAIRVEEIKSANVIRIPSIPNFKVKADFRQLNKRGHWQVTTVSKCDQCHVTSANKRIDQTTEDFKIGAEMTLGPITLDYTHLQRNFSEGGSFPIAYYGFGARSFPVKGFNKYGTVPDSRTYVNQIKSKARLPLRSYLYMDYEMGEHHNRETRQKREFESFAVRLTSASLKYVTFNFKHYDYNMDSNVRGAMDKDVRRSGISFSTKPWKRNFLRGSYRWEDIDRDNSAEESTLKKIFTLSLFGRPHRKLDFNARYSNERTDDPFLNEQWELFGFIQQTSLPNSRESVRISLNWNPRGNLSLSSTFTYEDADSDRYNIDEERMEMMFSIWFAPIDKLMITGSYSLIETEMETRSIYKTYHRRGPLDYLSDNSTNYDDKSQCYNLAVNYRFTRNIALVSNLTFNDSHADFDSRVYGSNIGELSDLNIENVDASIGIDYLYKPNLSFYTKYNYRDYNDREVNDLDGEVHLMSVGVNYTF